MNTKEAISNISTEEKVKLAAVLTQAAVLRYQKIYEGRSLDESSNAVDATYDMFKVILEKLLDE